MIQVGQKLPVVDLFVLKDGGPVGVSSDTLFSGKRVALFGVPGAFTRTCSAKHLPGFISRSDEFSAAGVDEIMCLSVNDPFVLAAWAEQHGANGKVSMIGDGTLRFTRAAGLEVDMDGNGFGARCRRFSMIVEDGQVTHIHLEEPGEFGATSAETLLDDLADAAKAS